VADCRPQPDEATERSHLALRTATKAKNTKERHRSTDRLLPVRSLSLAQRVVLVVALGLALLAVDDYMTPWSSGWFGYAPNTSITYVPEDGRLGHLALRGLLIAVWAAISVFILRSPKE